MTTAASLRSAPSARRVDNSPMNGARRLRPGARSPFCRACALRNEPECNCPLKEVAVLAGDPLRQTGFWRWHVACQFGSPREPAPESD